MATSSSVTTTAATGLRYDLYNVYEPAANEPLPIPLTYVDYGLNNHRQVIASEGGYPAVYEEGVGVTVLDDVSGSSGGGLGNHLLNDAGQFSWHVNFKPKG